MINEIHSDDLQNDESDSSLLFQDYQNIHFNNNKGVLMNELETKIHRTWVQLILESNYSELAAAVLDAELTILCVHFGDYGISIDLPTYSYTLIQSNPTYKEVLSKSLYIIAKGYLTDQNGNEIDPVIEFRIKLIDIEENW